MLLNILRIIVDFIILLQFIIVQANIIDKIDDLNVINECRYVNRQYKNIYCMKIFLNEEQMLGELYARKLARILKLDEELFVSGTIIKISSNSLGICNKTGDHYCSQKDENWIMLSPVIHEVNDVYVPFNSKNNSRLSSQLETVRLFDFLIGNVDRITSILINSQWNNNSSSSSSSSSSILYETFIPNLGSYHQNNLVMFDNDAAIFQATRIIHRYQSQLLQMLHQVKSCPPNILNICQLISQMSPLKITQLMRTTEPLQLNHYHHHHHLQFKFHHQHAQLLKQTATTVYNYCTISHYSQIPYNIY